MINMIRLRYHHLLCIYYFKGYGYDEAFVENMKNVKSRLDDEDIIITSSFDDLCKCCPNMINDKCRWEEKVNRYDNNLKSLISLDSDKLYKYKDIEERLNPIIKDKNRCHICDDCEWNKYCK